MNPKTKQEETWATLLATRWEQASGKIVQLAEAFSEEQFESKPIDTVRTCGQVIRHLAFWNQYVADTLRGKPADDSLNELPLAQYRTKARMMDALKRSSGEVVAAIAERGAALDLKSAEMVMTFNEHTSEHYGQLVVYGRMTGLVPPASRAQ